MDVRPDVYVRSVGSWGALDGDVPLGYMFIVLIPLYYSRIPLIYGIACGSRMRFVMVVSTQGVLGAGTIVILLMSPIRAGQ